MVAGVDQARRQLIAERTREAIAERKAAGTYHWPATLVDRSTVDVILRLSRRGWSQCRIARLLDAEGHGAAHLRGDGYLSAGALMGSGDGA